MNGRKLNENERKVLACLAEAGEDFGVKSFAPVMADCKLDRKAVRRACRFLARKGLTEYVRSAWTDDGEPYGAGYQITKAGRAAI